jgi:hypothetical protein
MELTVLGESGAQIVMGLHVVRLELERASKCGEGVARPARQTAGFSEAEPGGGVIRVERDGLAKPFDGEIVTAGLMRDETQQMQRVSVSWLCREDLAAEVFGVCQPASLVMLERDLESLGDCHFIDGWGIGW